MSRPAQVIISRDSHGKRFLVCQYYKGNRHNAMVADIELLIEPGPGRARIPAEFRELVVEAERQTR